VHALPYLDASSREYRERISQVTQAGAKKKQLGIAANTLGNSNRLDTASLFSALTPSIEQDLPVAIAVAWAISLGGDVRSNACLAGGLAGALWGQEAIPDEWLMFSEGVDYARAVADSLLHLTQV
jgi:ADP-ribosylglycohydrolase